MSKIIDLTGMRFGRLTVIERNGKNKCGDARWLCKCDCGNTTSVIGSKLRTGWTKSCGCLQREWASENFSTHRHSKTSLYNIWYNMKERCFRKTHIRYPRYGGRGIKICSEWMVFENFYDWAIANGYEEGLSLERKCIDGNYEPSNCCWIPRAKQAQNKSNTVWIVYRGERMCMAEFSRRIGVSVNVIRNRLKHGLSGDQIAEEFKK